MPASVWNPGSAFASADILFNATDPYPSQTVGLALQSRGISVKDFPFNAKGDGVTDDTAAIKLAISFLATFGYSFLFFPPGNYRISDKLDLLTSGVTLLGAGRGCVKIIQNNLAAKILNVTANFTEIAGLTFEYNGTPVSGATAYYTVGSFNHLHNFYIQNCYVGVEVDQGVANQVYRFDLRNYVNIGVFAHDLNDLILSHFIMDADTASGLLGGIRLQNKTEAVMISHGDIIRGTYSFTTAATTYALGVRPAYNTFVDVFCDSASSGALVEKSVATDFTDCWFSNRPSSGCIVQTSEDITFKGGKFINNAQHGLVIGAGSVRTKVIGATFAGNSTATANTYSGILVDAGVSDFTILGNTLGGTLGFGTQRHGIIVATGASDRYSIAYNQVSGNGTSGVSDGGTGVNKSVVANF